VNVRNNLVIRFGALGDLCLLGWSLSRLAAPERGRQRLTLVTKAAFAPLMAECAGVDRVIPLERGDLRGLWALAAALRRQNWDTIIDAHRVLRARGLLLLMGRAPRASLQKDTAQRLALLRGSAAGPELQKSMRQRFDEVCAQLRDQDAPLPVPPWGHLAAAGGQPAPLGLVPGAQWDTKRWPEEHYAQVLEHFLQQYSREVLLFLGPREERWFPGSRLARVAEAEVARVRVIRRQSLLEVARLLGTCGAVVTNDSGLLHLAEAVGTPVLAIFGPTVREFGYFPCLADSEVLEHVLDCRPCSRNGKRSCHRGDLACLRQISPDRAHPFLERMFGS
jgi:heptosyltransferase-2